MSTDILHKPIVLKLNANYFRIGWTTPMDAMIQMNSGTKSEPPAKALDISYELDENGQPFYDKMSGMRVLAWDEWIKLEIRSWDMTIKTVRQEIRIPTVIICGHYKDMPKKQLKPLPKNIRERDKNTCQYTGQTLTKATFSLDHIVPRKHGGRDTWENLVACHKDVNSKKGHALNHEIGLKLLKKPAAPKPIPLCELVRGAQHPDHQHF
jgi:5-methylcytosine-specific restriction endonuclease McrA